MSENEDVLDEVQRITVNFRPGTSSSEVNVFAAECVVPFGLLVRLEDEIVRLRNDR